MLNNKGQTLIFFVIIIPILILVFVFIIDLGLMNHQKNKLDILAYECITYKLDGVSDDKIEKIIISNDNKILYKITEDKISLNKEYKPIFNILNSNIIKSVYYIKDNKVIKKGEVYE